MSRSSRTRLVLRALIAAIAVSMASLTMGALTSTASATGVGSLSGQVSLPTFWAGSGRPADTRIVITLYRWNGSSFELGSATTYQPTPQDLGNNSFAFNQQVSATDSYAVSFSSPSGPYALPTTWLGGNPAPTGPASAGVYTVTANQTVTVQYTTIQDVLYGNGTVRDATGTGFSAQVTSYYWFNNAWFAYATTTAGSGGVFSVPMRPGHSMSFVVFLNGTAVAYSGGGSTFPAGPGAGDGSDGTFYYNTGGDVFVNNLYARGINAGAGGGTGGGTGGNNGGTNGGNGNGNGGANGNGNGAGVPVAKSKSYIQYRLTNAGLHPGQKAKFKVKISGPAGIPTGIVTLKTISGKLLGVANVRHDGTAVLRSYSLPEANYYVKIRYKGSHVYNAAKTKKLFFCVDYD